MSRRTKSTKDDNFMKQRKTLVLNEFLQDSKPAIEPKNFNQKVQSFIVNSYVEFMAANIAALAMFFPSWLSLTISLTTYILLVGVPILTRQRLRYQFAIITIMIMALFVGITLKIAYIQQFGFNDAQMFGIFVKNIYQMDYIKSFAFEFLTLMFYLFVWLITRHIRRKQKQAQLLEETPETFFGNNHYGQARQTLKYFFIGVSMFEGLSMPDLLALPLLYLILLLAIVRVVHLTKKRNRMSFTNDDHYKRDVQDWTTWAVEKDRLFNVIVYWQKICMVLQLAEFILSQVDGVEDEMSKADWVKEMLMWIRRDNFDSEVAYWRQVYEKIMTVAILFLAQCCEKSNSQYFSQEMPEENSTSNFVIKIAFLVTKIVHRCFGRHLHMKDFKKQLYGFMPVLLSWGVRITVALFAYIYNTHVGFYHLLWVIISFLIPTHLFLTVSTAVLFPIVCFEFAIIYMSNINTYIPVIEEYQFKPFSPFFELTLLYIMIILIGLMIPARLRFQFYVRQHEGSDMTKDFILDKIKNPKSSWIWKIIFIAMMNFKTPVLYLMLFIGNQNFNLFQLGFMMFFVIYGASDYLYIKTSILLPSFICYFIISQYYWSLVYLDYPHYNTQTDFYYLVDNWVPPADETIYWARAPNIQLWGLLFIMYLLHVICQQFPDTEQNKIYLQLCDKHISDVIPVIAKWFKLVWHALTMIVMITVLGYVAQQLLQYKSNIINLIYLALFVLTFGKMCSTSFDVSAFKECILFAKIIRTYSAGILILLVTYHMCRFEIFDFDDWFVQKKDSFWVLYLNIIGFPDAESDTKKAVQLYTAYLVVGQILENKFQSQMQKHESQYLFDWNQAFQDYRGVERAHEFFRFDTSYIAYRWFSFWPVMDFSCTYFHLVANAVIVYFGITLSISLFFAVHITMIVYFYGHNAYKLIQRQYAEIPRVVDMDEATELVRAYKKQMQDSWLKSRQSLWKTQYYITLFFLLMGYICQFIDEMVVRSNPQGTLRVQLETIRFYMFWSGCYFPPSLQTGSLNIQGLQPVHVMFLIILVEAQAQNWLQSRWGLDKQLLSNFIKLEFYRQLDTFGKQWLPDQSHPGFVDRCHNIVEVDANTALIKDIPLQQIWHLDQFHNALVVIWKELSSVQTMTATQLKALEIQCFFVFKIQVNLSSQFHKYKLKIDGQQVVLFQSMKDIILQAMCQQGRIDLNYVQFLSFCSINTLKQELVESLWYKFLDAAMLHNAVNEYECRDKITQQKKTIQILGLKAKLMKLVNRRYGYEMWIGLKLGFEQSTLLLLLVNICLKCNITSIVNLVLVTQFLVVKSKEQAMRNVTYVVGALCFLQYWFYLLNLTSRSSPTRFPNGPYPNTQDPEGQYLIPIMYKFEFGRDMRNAFWFSFGIELFDIQILWVDFATLALCAIYQAIYRNPVKSKTDQFTWPCSEWKETLEEYHELMTEKYPTELEYMNIKKRLKELKDNCVYYMLVKNSKILIFTTMHIFTQMVILLMALCRRSFISLFYVIALVPCLLQSASVLDQHKNYMSCQNELDTKTSLPEFQELTIQAQQKIISQIKYKYKWSFIDLICIWLSVYAWLDFVSQIAFQVPYIPKMPFLSHFGLRKIYDETSYDYIAFISGNYQAPTLNHQHLLMQFLSCVILCAISLQAELFKSKGYIQFLQKPDYGLDLLMKLAQLKKQAITYQYNNEKLYKILTVQKTEQQIFGCVERIKLNVDLFRKSQQRSMLTAYSRQNPGKNLYIAKTPMPETTRFLSRSDATYQMCLTSIQRLAKVLSDEKNRREKLVAEQTSYITQMKLPYRATVYLFLMKFSSTYLFIHRQRDMLKYLNNMEHGRQNTAVDLIRIIRGELFTILKRHEELTKQKMETWPDLKLEEMRQTQQYMRWSNIIPRQLAALCRAIISNTAVIAYGFMLLSMFTNAGIITLVYPLVVFGYALLEETRPGRGFWRTMLMFSLLVLLSKYLVNLEFVHINMSESIIGLDDYLKFGLHHIEHTKDLIWHMMPEMMIVTMILCHEIVEQFTGLYNRSELEVETVPEAIDRIFSTLKNNQLEEKMSDGQEQQLTILQQPRQTEYNNETSVLLKDKLLEMKSRDTIELATIEQVNRNSGNSLKFEESSHGSQFDIEEASQPKKKSIWSSNYVNRLFPSIQQQKPGVDYYGWQTLTGIILCYYLLKHFNQMSATGPYEEQNLFQSEMVYVMLYLMINLIIERYISRTESRKRIEKLKKTSDAVKPTINQNELFLPVKHGDLMVKMVIQKLRFQSLGDMGNISTLSKLRHEQGVEIAITESLVTPQQKCKFILHWINLVVVHLYIFWFVPLTSNITLYGTPVCGVDYGCKDFQTNENLQWFYIWFIVYFTISARQISQGLPSFRRGSSLMLYEGSENNHYTEDVFNFMIQIFCNTPLIVELRNLLDYTFTRSALDMWQTCQLFMYNADFYICKLSNREYNRKVLGVPVQGAKKLCYGYVCLAMMLTFVLGPFLLFSDFGGQTQFNPVVEDSLILKLQVNFTTVRYEGDFVKYEQQSVPIQLYHDEAPSIYDFTPEMFKQNKYNVWPETKFFDPMQVQRTVPALFSDTTWIASDQLRNKLKKLACIANIESGDLDLPPGCNFSLNETNIQNVTFGFQLHTMFRRDGPVNNEDASGIQQRNLQPKDSSSDRLILSQLSTVMAETCKFNKTQPKPIYYLNITDFFIPKLLLGKTTTVEPIWLSTHETEKSTLQNIILTYQCNDQWAISTGSSTTNKIQFTVFSQRIPVGWLQGYDVTSFYLSFVLIFGMQLRYIFIYLTPRSWLYEVTHPDPMLRLCESIHLCRSRGDLKMEDENHRLFLEILRSPELMHQLCGSTMKGTVAPSDKQQKSHLIPKAFT